jgi:hypothetical protein
VEHSQVRSFTHKPLDSNAGRRRGDFESLFIFGQAVFPAAARLLHVHDPAQNPSIIMPLATRLVGRQMRLDLQSLLVAEPEQICAHGAWLLNRLTKFLESTHGYLGLNP